MKKYIFLRLLLYLSIFANAQNCSVVLGTGKDCTGFNICSIYTEKADSLSQMINATISIESKKLQIAFFKENMADSNFVQYFLKEHFYMNADFKLPKQICKLLEIKKYTIKKGKYTIEDELDRIVVYF